MTIASLTTVLLAGLAGPAAASEPQVAPQQLVAASGLAPTVDPSRWVTGTFEISGAPILSNAPDRWSCHLGLSCRPEVLAEAGLDEDDRFLDLTTAGATVTVDCVTGAFGRGHWARVFFTGTVAPYRKLHGWVGIDAVDVAAAGNEPITCNPGDWLYE